MQEQRTTTSTDSLPPPSRGDRLEVVKILVLALISFLAGFALVFMLARPSTAQPEETTPAVEPSEADAPSPPDTEAESPAVQDNDEADPGEDSYAPVPSPSPSAQEEGEEQEDNSEPEAEDADPVAQLPPGKTPEGVALEGDAFYLKCWDADGIEHAAAECDKLATLEKRFATRLYAVDKCRLDNADERAQGKLSVASEVNFATNKISFWNGASSDIKNASEIGVCLRESLSGLPIDGVDHKYARYRIFFTVLFGKTATPKSTTQAGDSSKFVTSKAKLVNVVKDQVRIRKAPVDGDPIGKISSGSQVRFLKKKDDWCNVITPSSTEGWMICDALEL